MEGSTLLASKAMELTMLRSRLRMGFVSPTDPAGLDVFLAKKNHGKNQDVLGFSMDVPWIFHGQNTRKRLMTSDASLIFDNFWVIGTRGNQGLQWICDRRLEGEGSVAN